MFEQFMNEGVFLYVIAGMCGVGVLSSLWLNLLYKKLLRDTQSMMSPGTKGLRDLKSQFENTFKLNGGVSDITSFIEKWMARYKTLGISLHKLKRISSYAMVGCLLFGPTLGIYLYTNNYLEIMEMIHYCAVGSAGFFALLGLRGICDWSYKGQIIKSNIKEFLENSFSYRLEKEQRMAFEARKLKEEVRSRENQIKEAREVKEEVAVSESSKIDTNISEEVSTKLVSPIKIKTIRPIPVRELNIKKGEESFSDQEKEKENTDSYQINQEKIESQEDMKSNKTVASHEKKLKNKREKETALSQIEMNKNIAKMRESMEQIAAGTEMDKDRKKELLRAMSKEEQEEIIKEIIKEYLS